MLCTKASNRLGVSLTALKVDSLYDVIMHGSEQEDHRQQGNQN
jgi:hypothetical protein